MIAKNKMDLVHRYLMCYSSGSDGDSSSTYQIRGKNIDMEYDVVRGVCTGEWNTVNTKLQAVYDDYSGFDALENFIGAYIDMLRDSVAAILDLSKSMKDAVASYAQQLAKLDGGINGIQFGGPGGSYNGNGYGGNGGDGGGNTNSNTPEKTPSDSDDNENGDGDGDENENPSTDDGPVDPPSDVGSDPDSPPGTTDGSNLPDLSGLNLDFNDVTGIVTTLVEFAEQTDLYVDEALANSQLAAQLLEALLSSSVIPDELQSLLESAGSEVSQQLLEQLLHGDIYTELFDLNPLNLTVVRSYLEKVASENGITFDELISDPQYADILRESLSGFTEASTVLLGWSELSPEEYQAKLLQIFDGDEVGDLSPAALKIIREYIDVLAREAGVDAEEMLTDSRYAMCLTSKMESFGKAASFMGVHSYFSNDGMCGDIGGIFRGEKPNALGISDGRWYHTGLELMQYAEEHNVSLPDLMIDPKYADEVKQLLLSGDYTKEIAILFKDTDSVTVQTMARRVYSFLDYRGTQETEDAAYIESMSPSYSLWMPK